MLFNVVQRILVALKSDIFDNARTPLGLFLRGHALGLAVFPFRRKGDFFDARQKHGVKVLCHLHQNEFAPAAVLAVEVNDRVRRGAGAGEEVENKTAIRCRCCNQFLVKGHWMAIREI
jgi:hypothetical protein